MASRRDHAAEQARRNRAARKAGFANRYQQRLARARAAHPGVTTREARGHGRLGVAAAFRRRLARASRDPDAVLSFIGDDRQADGSWRAASFTFLDEQGEEEFLFSTPTQLAGLPAIAEAISGSGIFLIGVKYFQKLVAWVEEEQPFRFARGAGALKRWLRRFSSSGAALTTPEREAALVVDGLLRAEALFAERGLRRKLFRIEAA